MISTAVWYRGDNYDAGLEWAIWRALGQLRAKGNNCWERDPRRRVVYTLFSFSRKERQAARLWIDQAFGGDVKVQLQTAPGAPGAHD